MAAQPFKFADEIGRGYPELDRMALAIEALCFLLYALKWVSARRASERLRPRLYVPILNRMCDVFGDMIGKESGGASLSRARQAIGEMIAAREAVYSKGELLLGKDAGDERSTLHMASRLIAETLLGADDATLPDAIKRALLLRIDDLKLADRVRAIDSLLG
jgi:hypothetical protein